MSDARRELILLMQETRTSQARLSRLLGVSPVQVNRWLQPERKDGSEPPFYAINFLRCYIQLPESARARMTTFDTMKARRQTEAA